MPGLDTVGETWSVSGTTPPNYAQLIATWFRQRESYNLEMNSCTSAEMCSFYLQVVRIILLRVIKSIEYNTS